MKKPLMSVPPAQAEALYDAALLNAPAAVTPSRRRWDLLEWGEDDAPLERADASRSNSPREYTESSPSARRWRKKSAFEG